MSWIPYDDILESRWDDFVASQPGGRMVHLSGYKKVIEETYRFEPFYRAYVKDGTLQALFPGFFHKSLIYGRKIISQPFSEYGGILLSAGLSAAEKDQVLGEFTRLASDVLRAKRFDHLEMRNPMSLAAEDRARFRTLRLFRYAIRRLEAPEAMWKALDSKDRNVIQRARSFGLTVDEEPGEKPLRGKFYPLYLRTMKRLGSPPHPLALFLRLSARLEDRMKVLYVHHRRTAVAALIGWEVGTTVHVTDMCSDDAAFFLKPNDLVVWEFLRSAAERGYRFFDFGPVRYRGQEIFKKKWKMELLDYFYVVLSVKPTSLKNPFSSSGGLMAAAPKIWKAAMPIGLGRVLGRYARKEVGL
jgi:hypothetical protein